MKMAAIATQEQTLAMLKQRYLSAKYGLAEVKVSLPTTSSSSASNAIASDEKKTTNVSLPPADGPFGLQAGLTKKNIEDMTGESLKPIEGSVDLYMINSVPKTNSDFESFGLLISPKVGLCQIRAIGKDINTDSYGISLKSKFEEVSSTLSSIYGKGKKTDLLLSGSIWKNPNDWMMGLNKKERILLMEWNEQNDTMKKNEINNIGLEVRSNISSSGFLFLNYVFSNNEVCESEIETQKKVLYNR
jgi:hypothetical protein